MNRFKLFFMKYKKEVILGGFLMILFVGGVATYKIQQHVVQADTIDHSLKKEEEEISIVERDVQEETKEEEKEKKEKKIFCVDVKGEVNKPGVYQVEEDLRVTDAIEIAGGLTEQAETKVINLSRKVKDEMVIIVYSKQEVEDFKKVKEEQKEILEAIKEKEEVKNDALIKEEEILDNLAPDEEEIKEESNLKEEAKISSKISINKASKEELQTLTGIGESKAEAIIAYRNEKPFETIEDIMLVKGIGEKLFEQIKEDITI